MEIGPDGSLCRITSSAKGCVNNIKIIKKSENSDEPYTLIFVGDDENDSESPSEKSDDEKFETEIELNLKTFEEKKSLKMDKSLTEDKTSNENSVKKFSMKNFRPNMRRNRGYFSGSRNFKPDNKTKPPLLSNPSNDIYPITNTYSSEISPWLNPPQIYSGRQEFPPIIYPNFPPGLDSHCLNSSINPIKESPSLLGPYPNFAQNNFPHINQTNNYGHWDNRNSNSYQRPSRGSSVSAPSNHGAHYQNNHYKSYRRNKSSWKSNMNQQHPKGRAKNTGHFDYRKK